MLFLETITLPNEGIKSASGVAGESASLLWSGPQQVNLASISLDQERAYIELHHYFSRSDVQALAVSIQRIGLTAPLHLSPQKDDSYAIVSGYKRFWALQETGVKECAAYISPTSARAFELFLFRLSENSSHRRLNELEKTLTLKTVHSAGYDLREIEERFALMVGIPSRPEIIQNYLDLGTVGPVIFQAIADEQITVLQAGELARLSSPDREILFTTQQQTKWNNNEFIKVMNLLTDITHRDNTSISEILGQPLFEQIRLNDNFNRREKGKHIISALLKSRYPAIQEHEDSFQNVLKDLRIPPEIRITPPENFEGNQLNVQIVARDREHLDRLIAKLATLSTQERIQKLFDYF